MVQTLSSMRNSQTRSIHVALAIFLTKMHLGLSNRVLAVLFHLKDKRAVSHIIGQVCQALIKDFVPLNLGFQHIGHQEALIAIGRLQQPFFIRQNLISYAL